MQFRLRTKFLLSTLLISTSLTGGSLFFVRRIVRMQARRQIDADLRSSVLTFQNAQHQREVMLRRSARLLADLPTTRALMTTRDPKTIADASVESWRLSGSDLFLLADPAGKIMTFHTEHQGVTAAAAQEFVSGALWDESGQWWYGDKQLYQVFLQPIYFGPAKEDRVLGFLVLGYEVDDRLTGEVSRVAASQVAFRYGHAIVRSTLSPVQEAELLRQSAAPSTAGDPATQDIRLGNERFLTASVELASGAATPVQLFVLKSLDQATGFLDPLNQQLVGLGAEAVLLGGMLVFFISRTFARPLEELVAGVRALEKGDFDYPLDALGSDEAAELTRAFARMRHNLQKTQRELLEIERLATIGRMANSISHDLRHSLAVVVANSEFLCQGNLTTGQREELYQEVCLGVNQMTDLIDSLLEFSRTRESLRPAHGNVQAALEHARQAVQAHPEYSRVNIEISCEGRADAWFDAKKLERAFQNLLLNACEAVPREAGRIQVTLKETGQGLEARVKDNGPGISAAVRDKLFEPFVSFGKENGTGLGLTVVQKILQDHGGDVVVESSSSQGTVFKVTLPVPSYAETVSGSGK